MKIHNLNPKVALHFMFMALKGRAILQQDPPYDHGRPKNESHWQNLDGRNGRVFTPFNAGRAVLFEEACSTDLITLPPNVDWPMGLTRLNIAATTKTMATQPKGA
ncbi:hypothetical protein CR513_50910, partial [Mucuna pruriens]